LLFGERRVKLIKYLRKKKRRVERGKFYSFPKKSITQNRLRLKGKFITQEQAC
jgi:hypothetical protein